MTNELTYRQRKFLSDFLVLYQEVDLPLHYVFVAEQLSIGKVTAYEMLRLLEENGLVSSEYQKKSGPSGPGRSIVLFYPTRKAQLVLKEMAEENIDLEDWIIVKDQILKKLHNTEIGVNEELLEEILLRIPERRSPIIIITELITAVILMLNKIKDSPGVESLLQSLQQVGLPKKASLHVMSGIATFLSAIEKTNRHNASVLLSEINRYEDALAQLNSKYQNIVSQYTREVVQILLD